MTNPWDTWSHRKGFGKIKYYGAEYWGEADPQQREQLDRASVPSTARIVASVTEHTPLGLMSDQDGGTWGAARYAGGSDVSFFRDVAASPEARAALANDPDALRAFATAHHPSAEDSDLRRAWYLYARQPWMQRLYWDRWFKKFLTPAYQTARSLGWSSELGVASLARIRNSAPAKMQRAVTAARSVAGGERAQIDAALKNYAEQSSRYAERVAELRRDHPYDVKISRAPQVSDLYLDAAPQRPGGAPLAPFNSGAASPSPSKLNLPGLAVLLAGVGGFFF
jgi:hypothetical protein